MKGEGEHSSSVITDTVRELELALEDLRAAQQALLVRRETLESTRAVMQAEREKYWQLFDALPEPYLVTRLDSVITDANRAAADLLNISQRFLSGKALSIFVCRDRARFLSDAARVAANGETAVLNFTVRPRERAPLEVVARVGFREGAEGVELHWNLQAAPRTH